MKDTTVVPRLVEFIAQNGGSIDRAKLSIFLQKYPKSKSNLGDLYAFCARPVGQGVRVFLNFCCDPTEL